MDFPNWIIGVLLACMASFISNLGLNLQKLNHLRNDRAAASVASSPRASKPSSPPHLPPYNVARASSLSSPSSASSLSSQTYRSYLSTENIPPSKERLTVPVLPSPTILPSPLAKSFPAPSPSNSTSFPSPSPTSSNTDIPLPSRTPSPPPPVVSYHRQTLWRIGLGLVIVGSLSDFVALIFAAQSIIAPLGSLTLVSNTVMAPFLLDERVGRIDVIATIAIVVGSSLSVACADHRDRMYGLDELFGLFIKPRFLLYSLLITAVIAALYYHIRHLTSATAAASSASTRKHARFCYASLAGIVGAQSVLFAKCVGTMLVDLMLGHSLFFLHVWSYVILALLTLTITFQVHYLNEGLRLFTSSYIIPIYQSCWIVGSVVSGMVFFGEYKGVFDKWSGCGFPVGVLIVVAAVYVLSQHGGMGEDEGEVGEEEGEEGEEGLVEAEERVDVRVASESGENGRTRYDRVQREDAERKRNKAAARMPRSHSQLPYQLPLANSQSHHIAFPSASSSSFFLHLPSSRSLHRPISGVRSRTELQTAPIVSSPVLYMHLSSSSPEASYVPEVSLEGRRKGSSESRVRESKVSDY